jgi:hypothetical protein
MLLPVLFALLAAEYLLCVRLTAEEEDDDDDE